MGAQNKVIAGDYMERDITCSAGGLFLGWAHEHDAIELNKNSIKQYEAMDEDLKKSAASAVGRAALGAVLLGPVGLFAGFSAKKKGIYLIAIEFNDGKKSLVEIDEKRYKLLLKIMF